MAKSKAVTAKKGVARAKPSASGKGAKPKPVAAKKAVAKPAKKAAKPAPKKPAALPRKPAKAAKPVAKRRDARSQAVAKPKPKPVAKKASAAKKATTPVAKVPAKAAAKQAPKSAVKPAPATRSAPAGKHAPSGKPQPKPSAPSLARPVTAVVKAGNPISPPPQKTVKVEEAPRKATARKGVIAPASAETGITMEGGRYALAATTHVDLPKGYRPSNDEEYMGPTHLAYFRQKLRDWREQLVEESKQTIDNLRDEVRDIGDEAERATRETENSLELRTRDRYRKLIAKIDKALKRIEEGRYGYCEETDEEIGIERLEARPIATLCLDAQERWEHRQRQMGD
ncbi:MAG TPA: RNA polymerase-binding protein DksA [Rhodanobacteraceae bacterium]|nr:RNA polymerase-binding protein DksA [Rhodanobacteraceae bacterium]